MRTAITRFCSLGMILLLLVSVGACARPPGKQNDSACQSANDIFVYKPDNFLSVPSAALGRDVGVTTWIYEEVKLMMVGLIKAIYQAIATDEFKGALKAAITLFVTFYGFGIVMGIVQATPYDLFRNVFRIGLVWMFATQWDTFEYYVVNNFDALITELTKIFINIFSQGIAPGATGTIPGATTTSSTIQGIYAFPTGISQDIFQMVDMTLSLFLSTGFFKLILATLFSGWSGVVYSILLTLLVMNYVFAAMSIIYIFVVALIFRHILLGLAPLYIPFIMFKRTKTIFDGWIEQLTNFTVQPILAGTFAGLSHLVLLDSLSLIPSPNMALSNGANVVQICYSDLSRTGGWFETLYFYGLYKDGGSNLISGFDAPIPLRIWAIIACVILTMVIRSMMDWSSTIAARMSSGIITATELAPYGWASMKATGAQALGGAVGGVRGMTGGLQGMREGAARGWRAGESQRRKADQELFG